MRVREIMTRDVFALPHDATLDEASTALTSRRIGGAPVLSHGRVVGVVSKTDLVARGRGRAPLRVSDVMTPFAYWVGEDDSAEEARRRMLAEHVHRMIVIGKTGELAGIVTAIDLLRALDPATEHRDPEHAEAASAIPPGPDEE
ncbi:MAG TPA: CBS domain-containing protein [Minicystis sp.]|nr:CBS domain-containing protein [Minicystis sp.]